MASTMGPLNNATTSIVATMLDTLSKGILNAFKPGGPTAMFAFRGVFISVVSTSNHLNQAGTLKRQIMSFKEKKLEISPEMQLGGQHNSQCLLDFFLYQVQPEELRYEHCCR